MFVRAHREPSSSWRRRALLVAACVACGTALAACSTRHEPATSTGAAPLGVDSAVVNVFAWADYVPRDVMARFEAETGIKVNTDVFDNNAMIEARLLAGQSGYDVVVPSAASLARMVDTGLWHTLDFTAIPRRATLDPELMTALARSDPGTAHSVPYFWGTVGIGYDADRVEKALGRPVSSWFDLFDPTNAARLQSCGIAMLDDAVDTTLSALIALGRNAPERAPADLQAAEQLLAGVRPYVRYFHSSQYIGDLANGEICIALGYSGDFQKARAQARAANRAVRIEYVVPKEGAVLWMDVLAVPHDAPHAANAHRFIDFMLRPDIAATLSNRAGFASSVVPARALVDAALRDDPAVYPPDEVRKRLFADALISRETNQAMQRAWTRVKTGT